MKIVKLPLQFYEHALGTIAGDSIFFKYTSISLFTVCTFSSVNYSTPEDYSFSGCSINLAIKSNGVAQDHVVRIG
jgi:hypothetical protein